LAVFSINRQ